jgi:drug/metabolite transporter (DMT)-like permease
MSTSAPRLLSIPSLLLGATLWGVIWYPYRLLQEAGVGGALSSFASYLFPLLLVGPFLLRGAVFGRGNTGWLIGLALSAGWTNLAFVLAVIEGEVMRVTLLFYLAPVWTIFAARLLLGERLSRTGAGIMALSFAGALVMLWPEGGGWPLPANQPEWLALSAGLAFAVSNVITRKLEAVDNRAKSLTIWLGVGMLAGVATLLQGVSLTAFVQTAPISVWGLIAAIGITLGVMTLAVQYGLTHLPANQAILIMLFELVAAAVSSYFLAAEAMGMREWLGSLMIIVGGLLSARVSNASH